MKELNKLMYVIVDKRNNPHTNTLRFYRKDCISDFIGEDSEMNWDEAKRFGWKCIKVEVNIRMTHNEWR